MITRLKVDGFKNLVGVDLRLGPFTCIAGANGMGKSNLFDAIRFLSNLASHSLTEAALSVRDEQRASDVRSIFHRSGSDYAPKMSFEVEMIVPMEATDELGQSGRATTTFLRYSLDLGWRMEKSNQAPMLEISKEELTHINLGEASRHLGFLRKGAAWKLSVIRGVRRGGAFISTQKKDGQTIIRRHQDGGSRGNPMPTLAHALPRTILSAATAAEAPTVLCAKREMESWTLLQLEPSALRRPDELNSPSRLASDGSGLPATLYRLGTSSGDPVGTCANVANRVAELIDDVKAVAVDRDDKRELLTLSLTGRDGTSHAARALSDGTLRFLALAILEADPRATGVICLEEPENGIHPDRIHAMLRLLQDIPTDTEFPVGADNPLRQVIINTHSPLVVAECPDDSLLIAHSPDSAIDGRLARTVQFSHLTRTWRDREKETVVRTASRADLLAYLQPLSLRPRAPLAAKDFQASGRIVDRSDIGQIFFSFPGYAVAEKD